MRLTQATHAESRWPYSLNKTYPQRQTHTSSHLCVYVDHMTIVGDDEVEKQILREKLAPQFDLKKLKYISVIEVVYP